MSSSGLAECALHKAFLNAMDSPLVESPWRTCSFIFQLTYDVVKIANGLLNVANFFLDTSTRFVVIGTVDFRVLVLILHLLVILALLLHLCILLDFICYIASVLARIKVLFLNMWIDLAPSSASSSAALLPAASSI